jgi:hypothetical protein
MPDLTVAKVWWDPASPLEGDTVIIYVAEANIGDADAGPHTDRITVNVEPTDFLDSGLAAGASRTFQLTVTNVVPGTYNIKIILDANNDLTEKDEANNMWEGIITVSPVPHQTTTILVSGMDAVIDRFEGGPCPPSVTFSVNVMDIKTGEKLHGVGLVEFYVNGVLVGSDGDVDNDGVYGLTWNPPSDWLTLGTQPWEAKFTGTADYKPSSASSTLTIHGKLYQTLLSPKGETYRPGDTVQIAAQITSDSPLEDNIKGCAVTATLIAPDGTSLTPITLEDPDNDGIYTGSFDITSTTLPGWWQIEVLSQKTNYHECTLTTEKAFYVEIPPPKAGVEVSIDPLTARVELGNNVNYTIHIHNTGAATDTYDITIEGISTAWYTLSSTQVTVEPGETAEVILTVTPPYDALTCKDEETYSFTVKAASKTDPTVWDTADAEVVVYISWEYVFEDPVRHTILKISTNNKCFQFIAPDKTFKIKHDPAMVASGSIIIIKYTDAEISITTTGINTKYDFCMASIKDMETGRSYMLYDPYGKE